MVKKIKMNKEAENKKDTRKNPILLRQGVEPTNSVYRSERLHHGALPNSWYFDNLKYFNLYWPEKQKN